jgi:hypothetical protein
MKAISTKIDAIASARSLATKLEQIELLDPKRLPTNGNLLIEAIAMLESLPLTTQEFGLSRCRLNNANAYLASGEFGAANFELILVRRWLGVFIQRFANRYCKARDLSTSPVQYR